DIPGIALLVAGGVVYTVGAVFYALKKYRYMHSVWHIFVLAGSIFHYFSILLYVLPAD
ncbi:MAG: hemolysin III family protein, partial [Oscillospiraceae bacterium]|nr:hemolysin III family protein [Oscillospiraceae bacterium]